MSSTVVVIVVRDRFSMFRECIERLYAHTKYPFRLMIIAGGVDTGTKEYLYQVRSEKDDCQLVLGEHILTQAGARNLALEESNERFVCILENDTLVHDDWLPRMLDCMTATGAAVVTPLIWWYRGIHTAGGTIIEQEKGGKRGIGHRILYSGVCRKQIDYPENHCILIDREKLPGSDLFHDVEPFDVDLGLTVRRLGLSVFLEPTAEATYMPSPPLEVCDILPYKYRWDPDLWETRNRNFQERWSVVYDAAPKLASYHRQQLKLGLARWYPNKMTVKMSNTNFRVANWLQGIFQGNRRNDEV